MTTQFLYDPVFLQPNNTPLPKGKGKWKPAIKYGATSPEKLVNIDDFPLNQWTISEYATALFYLDPHMYLTFESLWNVTREYQRSINELRTPYMQLVNAKARLLVKGLAAPLIKISPDTGPPEEMCIFAAGITPTTTSKSRFVVHKPLTLDRVLLCVGGTGILPALPLDHRLVRSPKELLYQLDHDRCPAVIIVDARSIDVPKLFAVLVDLGLEDTAGRIAVLDGDPMDVKGMGHLSRPIRRKAIKDLVTKYNHAWSDGKVQSEFEANPTTHRKRWKSIRYVTSADITKELILVMRLFVRDLQEKGTATITLARAISVRSEIESLWVLTQLFEEVSMTKDPFASPLNPVVSLKCTGFKAKPGLRSKLDTMWGQIGSCRKNKHLIRVLGDSISDFDVLCTRVRENQTRFNNWAKQYHEQVGRFVLWFRNHRTTICCARTQIEVAFDACMQTGRPLLSAYLTPTWRAKFFEFFAFYDEMLPQLKHRLGLPSTARLVTESLTIPASVYDGTKLLDLLKGRNHLVICCGINGYLANSVGKKFEKTTVLVDDDRFRRCVEANVSSAVSVLRSQYVAIDKSGTIVLLDLVYRNLVSDQFVDPLENKTVSARRIKWYRTWCESNAGLVARVPLGESIEAFQRQCQAQDLPVPNMSTIRFKTHAAWLIKR